MLPVVKKPEITGGIVQVAVALVYGTIPVYVAKYAIAKLSTGTATNGIKSSTFKTIGIPNIAGSLMLKSPGTSVRGASALVR